MDDLPLLEFTEQKRKVYTVSEITGEIKEILEEDFRDVWVEGEIGQCKTAASGHMYLSLKDASAVLGGIIFKNALSAIKFPIKEGLKVLCSGRLSVYEPQGTYRLIIDRVEVAGKGALQQAFEEMKAKLQDEGLFAADHKRPLPVFPQRIGIVTSPTGAVIRDILNILSRRFENLNIIIAPAMVQGEQAPPQIVEALTNLNRMANPPQVIIIARGGGSLEDLWAFNDERVARAVYASPIPVISAIGHETDFTICDFVADLRAPTPSAAAELVIRPKLEFQQMLQNLQVHLIKEIQWKLDQDRQRLKELESRPVFTQPTKTLETYIQRVDEFSERCQRTTEHRLEMKQQQMSGLFKQLKSNSPQNKLELWKQKNQTIHRRLVTFMDNYVMSRGQELKIRMGKLDALSPLAILSRGYSISFHIPSGEIIREAAKVNVNDAIRIRLHQGQLEAKITGKEE